MFVMIGLRNEFNYGMSIESCILRVSGKVSETRSIHDSMNISKKKFSYNLILFKLSKI